MLTVIRQASCLTLCISEMVLRVVHSLDCLFLIFRQRRKTKSIRNIAQAMGKRRNAIHNIIHRYDKQAEKPLDTKKIVQPRCINHEQDALPIGNFQGNCIKTTVGQAAGDLDLSSTTVINRLIRSKGPHVHHVPTNSIRQHKEKQEH